MLWIALKQIIVDCLRRVVDTGKSSGISVESCTRFQNLAIPGQPFIIIIIVYLYSAQYLHILQDSKRYLTN